LKRRQDHERHTIGEWPFCPALQQAQSVMLQESAAKLAALGLLPDMGKRIAPGHRGGVNW
jgi:hypothetical protein